MDSGKTQSVALKAGLHVALLGVTEFDEFSPALDSVSAAEVDEDEVDIEVDEELDGMVLVIFVLQLLGVLLVLVILVGLLVLLDARDVGE